MALLARFRRSPAPPPPVTCAHCARPLPADAYTTQADDLLTTTCDVCRRCDAAARPCLACHQPRALSRFTPSTHHSIALTSVDVGGRLGIILGHAATRGSRDAYTDFVARPDVHSRPLADVCTLCRLPCSACQQDRDPDDFLTSRRHRYWLRAGLTAERDYYYDRLSAEHRAPDYNRSIADYCDNQIRDLGASLDTLAARDAARDYAPCDWCSGWRRCATCSGFYRQPSYDPSQEHCDACLRRAAELAAADRERAAQEAEAARLAALPPPPPPFTLGTADDGAPIVLTPSVRNRHLYIIGKTGSGKSSLLRNLIMQDLDAGRGVIFLDPHGDTAQQLLGYVPEHRAADVTYFCPTDPQAPSFNLLASPYPADKLTRDMVSAIKMFFGDSWGPRLNQLLTNALATLLLDRDHEAHTLADLETLLLDAGYRADVVARCRQPRLQGFWQGQFPTMSKDAVNPVLNKLADLLMPTSPLERIFSARTNSLDLTATMDGGRILLCNLSKGELGDAAAFLLGGLIVTAVAQAALARATQPEAERRDVFLYVDEFQNFAIESFQTILSEARKYRLNLTLAHQYLHQVPADLQAAIFGNVAVVAAFATSAADGAIMRREMAHPVTTVTGDNAEAIAAAEERNRLTYKHAREQVLAQWARHPIAYQPTAATIAHQTEDLATDHLKPVPEYATDTTEELWPEARDFLTLEPLHGFVKIGTVDTTQRFAIAHPVNRPDPERAAAIIAHQRAQHVAPRLDDATATSPPPPPRDPDDFAF